MRYSIVGRGMLSLLALSPALQAQAPSSPSLEEHCAAVALTVRESPDRDRRVVALEMLGVCPAELRIGTLVARLRQDRQMDAREAGRVIMPLTVTQDDRLFQEVLLAAGDPVASIPVRVVAFMALAVLKDPQHSPDYDRFSAGLNARGHPRLGCSWRTSGRAVGRSGPMPLRADYLAQIQALKQRVYRDVAEPDPIRSAAACV